MPITTTSTFQAPATDASVADVAVAAAAKSEQDQMVQRLTAAAVKFESYFVAQMMKQMRQATAALADPGSAINDRANESTLALAEQSVADSLAGQRAFGIADVLVRQMLPASGAMTGAAANREIS